MSYRTVLENMRRQLQEPVEPVEVAQAPKPRGLASPKRMPAPPTTPEYEPLNFTRNALKSVQEAREEFDRHMDRLQATRPPTAVESISSAIAASPGPAVEEGSTRGLFSPRRTETETPGSGEEEPPLTSANTSPRTPRERSEMRALHVDLSQYDLPEEELSAYAQSIKDIESSGGNYSIRGPVVRSGRYAGERAMGAYQVMPGNLSQWSRQALGREVSEEEFMASEEIQDRIFFDQATRQYRRHGNWQDVASVWFTGQPLRRGGDRSDGYITGNQYVDRFTTNFNRYLGGTRG